MNNYLRYIILLILATNLTSCVLPADMFAVDKTRNRDGIYSAYTKKMDSDFSGEGVANISRTQKNDVGVEYNRYLLNNYLNDEDEEQYYIADTSNIYTMMDEVSNMDYYAPIQSYGYYGVRQNRVSPYMNYVPYSGTPYYGVGGIGAIGIGYSAYNTYNNRPIYSNIVGTNNRAKIYSNKKRTSRTGSYKKTKYRTKRIIRATDNTSNYNSRREKAKKEKSYYSKYRRTDRYNSTPSQQVDGNTNSSSKSSSSRSSSRRSSGKRRR